MKFSIVISTYNRLSLLKRAIHSALFQTIPCEVVVSDDCSPDDTQAYVESLGNQVVYHRNPVNSGHSATVNAGVAAASGDWIKFVDDDDYLAPNCIEEMTKAIALHPQAVICSCQAAQVDINEVVLSITRKPGPGNVFYIPQEDIHYGMLLELVPFGTPIQVACRRDAFLKSQGWDSRLDANCDDIDSWIKIAQFGDALFINQKLAYRTIWPGAYNQKFTITKRLETNLLIKSKIYSLVTEKYRNYIPKMDDLESYLKIHWGLSALKQRRSREGIMLILSHLFSLSAWQLLIQAKLYHHYPKLLPQNPIYHRIMRNLPGASADETQPNFKNLKMMQTQVRLRASRLAWQQRNVILAMQMGLPVLFSLEAWKLLAKNSRGDKFRFSLNDEMDKPPGNIQNKFYQILQRNPRSPTPELTAIRDYLRLHWGLVALKEGKIKQGLSLITPSLLSSLPWQILINAIKNRFGISNTPQVRKIVLIESYSSLSRE